MRDLIIAVLSRAGWFVMDTVDRWFIHLWDVDDDDVDEIVKEWSPVIVFRSVYGVRKLLIGGKREAALLPLINLDGEWTERYRP